MYVLLKNLYRWMRETSHNTNGRRLNNNIVKKIMDVSSEFISNIYNHKVLIV